MKFSTHVMTDVVKSENMSNKLNNLILELEPASGIVPVSYDNSCILSRSGSFRFILSVRRNLDTWHLTAHLQPAARKLSLLFTVFWGFYSFIKYLFLEKTAHFNNSISLILVLLFSVFYSEFYLIIHNQQSMLSIRCFIMARSHQK